MKYLLLIHDVEADWAKMGEAEILAESVNALPEDTLKDSLVAITRGRE